MADNTSTKHYDTDWAKAKSRDLVGKMLDETILTFRKPSQVKVLHFGGVDLAEAKQIYLPRGILPKNIVSIERERDIAQEQKRLGTGIKVVHSTLEGYLAQQEEIDFDVVSLDYIGPIGTNQESSLYSIRLKQNKKHFLFHIANLLRRDHKSVNSYARGFASSPQNSSEGVSDQVLLQDLFKKWRYISEKIAKEEEMHDEKREAYSSIIEGQFNGHKSEDLDRLARFIMGDFYDTLVANTLVEVEKGYPFFKDYLGDKWDLFLAQGPFNASLEVALAKQIKSICKYGELEEAESKVIYLALTDVALRKERYFESLKSRKYYYISESGAPMIGDIHFFSMPVYTIEIAKDIARLIGYPKNLELEDLPTLRYSLGEFFTRSMRDIARKPFSSESERIFLGNSSKPVLTKKRFIEELESGRDVEAIKAEYRGWQSKPLAQWKAHYTMGTYSSEKMVERNGEDSDLEKLSKEDAIDLLSSGIPPQEIYLAWPTSFTLGQLRVYKAHITMETYKKEDSPAESKEN